MNVPSLVAGVLPLPNSPPVERHWEAFGLPASGWLMLRDKAACVCPTGQMEPCVLACVNEFGLPAEARLNLGVCTHCEQPRCEEACPVDAIVSTEQGIVEIDQEACIGCRFCADACPNQALLWIDPYQTPIPPFGVANYTPDKPSGEMPSTVVKCTFCAARLKQGRMPACAEACPTGSIWIGNLDRDTATNGRVLIRLSRLLDGRVAQVVPPGERVVDLQ